MLECVGTKITLKIQCAKPHSQNSNLIKVNGTDENAKDIKVRANFHCMWKKPNAKHFNVTDGLPSG